MRIHSIIIIIILYCFSRAEHGRHSIAAQCSTKTESRTHCARSRKERFLRPYFMALAHGRLTATSEFLRTKEHIPNDVNVDILGLRSLHTCGWLVLRTYFPF